MITGRVISLGLFLVCLLSTGAQAQYRLLFVPEKPATRDGGATALDRFSDSEVVDVRVKTDVKPAKWISEPVWNALLGDEDGDSDFLERGLIDQVNALALLPGATEGNHFGIVFAAQADFGQAFGEVDDGSLWRLRPPPVAAGQAPVIVFLASAVLSAGLGTIDDFELDAVAFDATGNLYLSFAGDVQILGGTDLVQNGAVVAFEAAAIQKDGDGNITSVGVDTVQIVAREDLVNSIVANAVLLDEDGIPIPTMGNLQGLEVDPTGGTFVGSDGQDWPNLYLCGSNTGPRIVTTDQGGTIGRLDGSPLGIPSEPDFSPFGLDGSSDKRDIASIAVFPRRPALLTVDLDGDGFTPTVLDDTISVGFGDEGDAVLGLFSIAPTNAGANFASQVIKGVEYPAFYTLPLNYLFQLGSIDSEGRAFIPISLPAGIPSDLNVVLQIVTTSVDATVLSAPLILHYDAEG